MRIIFLISSLGRGGAERVATSLVSAWADQGHDVYLLTTFSGASQSAYVVDSRVKFENLSDLIGGTRNGKRYIKRLVGLRDFIIKKNPDVVISFLPNVNIAAILATAFTGIPCIIGERSDPEMQPIGQAWLAACRLLYRFADVVTVQTDSVAQRIGNVYPRIKHVSVVPNPLPPELAELAPLNASISTNKDRRILLFVGRLSLEKRVDRIVNSFVKVAHKHPEWDLYLLGEGPMRVALQDQIDHSSLELGRVRLLGQSDRPWQVMLESDAFIMASAYEGFPNALLEAVALGLPSLSTDCRSGPSEIGNDGEVVLLVPNDDEQALLSALDLLLGDRMLRTQLSRRGAAFVREKFSLERVLTRWDALFDLVRDRK